MNDKGTIKITLLVIIVALVAALVYVVAVPKSERNGEPAPGQNSPPSPLFDKEGKGEFQGWKTYRNEEYGFEVKYPPNFSLLDEDPYVFQIEGVKRAQVARFYSPKVGLEDSGTIEVEIVEKRFDPLDIYIDDPNAGRIVKPALETIDVGGGTARSWWSGHAQCFADIVEIPRGNVTIELRFGGCEGDKVSSRDYESQILSTFKFLE